MANWRESKGNALVGSEAPLPSTVLGVEQSNSSMVFDNKYFLKLYRKLEDGVNPDVEVTRFLSEQAGFAARARLCWSDRISPRPQAEPTVRLRDANARSQAKGMPGP